MATGLKRLRKAVKAGQKSWDQQGALEKSKKLSAASKKLSDRAAKLKAQAKDAEMRSQGVYGKPKNPESIEAEMRSYGVFKTPADVKADAELHSYGEFTKTKEVPSGQLENGDGADRMNIFQKIGGAIQKRREEKANKGNFFQRLGNSIAARSEKRKRVWQKFKKFMRYAAYGTISALYAANLAIGIITINPLLIALGATVLAADAFLIGRESRKNPSIDAASKQNNVSQDMYNGRNGRENHNENTSDRSATVDKARVGAVRPSRAETGYIFDPDAMSKKSYDDSKTGYLRDEPFASNIPDPIDVGKSHARVLDGLDAKKSAMEKAKKVLDARAKQAEVQSYGDEIVTFNNQEKATGKSDRPAAKVARRLSLAKGKIALKMKSKRRFVPQNIGGRG